MLSRRFLFRLSFWHHSLFRVGRWLLLLSRFLLNLLPDFRAVPLPEVAVVPQELQFRSSDRPAGKTALARFL